MAPLWPNNFPDRSVRIKSDPYAKFPLQCLGLRASGTAACRFSLQWENVWWDGRKVLFSAWRKGHVHLYILSLGTLLRGRPEMWNKSYTQLPQDEQFVWSCCWPRWLLVGTSSRPRTNTAGARSRSPPQQSQPSACPLQREGAVKRMLTDLSSYSSYLQHPPGPNSVFQSRERVLERRWKPSPNLGLEGCAGQPAWPVLVHYLCPGSQTDKALNSLYPSISCSPSWNIWFCTFLVTL